MIYFYLVEFKNQLPCLRHSGSSNIATDHIRNILKGKGPCYVKFESFNPVQVSLYKGETSINKLLVTRKWYTWKTKLFNKQS